MKGGEVEWKRNGTVVVSKGEGKRDVLTIPNKHMLKFVPVSNESSEVKMKPNIVRDYNDGMSGINSSSDALLLSRFWKSVQWYKKIGFHFITMFMHNSFYLFKKASPQSKMNLIDFRTYVINSLLDFYKKSRMERKPSNNVHYPECIPFLVGHKNG